MNDERCNIGGDLNYIQINPDTLGQFTGFVDKNRVKIFEGDWVKCGKYYYQIIFGCGSFCLMDEVGEIIRKLVGMNDHIYSLMTLCLESDWEEDVAELEVVGNIHDNSKLIKESVDSAS